MSRIFYLLGTLMIITGIAFATRVEAVNTSVAVQTLPARPSTQSPVLVARNDAFVPLALGSAGQTPMLPPQFPGRPGQPYASVPNPSGGAGTSGQQLVVLCTVFSGPNARLEFLVGDRVVYAGVGTVVGGYRVASVETDRVRFEDGEILEMSDCSGALRGQTNFNGGVEPTPAPGTNAGLPDTSAAAAAAALRGQTGMNGAGVTVPTVNPPTISTSATTNSLYGGQTSPYGAAGGATVYGQPLPGGSGPSPTGLNGQPNYVPRHK